MWGGIGFLLGIACAQHLVSLPAWWLGSILALCLGGVQYLLAKSSRGVIQRRLAALRVEGSSHRHKRGQRIKPFISRLAYLGIGFGVALSYAVYQAQSRLDDSLQTLYANKISHVQLRVRSIALYYDNAVQFDAEILPTSSTKSGLPHSIRVFWSLVSGFHLYQTPKAKNFPDIRPGQVWEMSLLLKNPNTLINPGGFDNEQFLFRENIRAVGTVKNTPHLIGEKHTWYTYIQAWRHDLRQHMQHYLKDKRYGAILIALVMGDQQGITQEDWQLFNRTGMTHLVSISGSHITMLSGLAMALCLWCLKRVHWRTHYLADRVDVTLLVGMVGVMVALGYCLLAGWGVPAQRTFLMLLGAYLCTCFRYTMTYRSQFLWVACIVALLDPWAILTTGFYLSFAAVAVLQQLMLNLRHSHTRKHPVVQMLKQWCVLQLMLSLATVPFLLYFFNQVSIISPLVNAYAIVSIGMVITPLALLLGILSYGQFSWVSYLADGTHFLLEKVMSLSEYLGRLSWASVDVAQVPWFLLLLGGAGIVYGLLPRGLPWRKLSLVLLVPAFCLKDKPLQEGEWYLWAFDIGQAGAVLIKTRQHAVLFDTGLRLSPNNESASRVLLPAFRALGIAQLDDVVVSHADLDHSGGLSQLIQSIPVQHLYASFRVDHFIDEEERLLGQVLASKNSQLAFQACHLGIQFSYDGVVFRFLNLPLKQATSPVFLPNKSKNYQSCVLAIEGRYHRALLTGDIATQQEQELISQKLWQSPYHIVQVPHHGSLSSSSMAFIRATQAGAVFAQTGFQNRFRHPHPLVQQRWQSQGILFFNTALTGAIRFASTATGLDYQLLREKQRRYWHR